MRNKKHLKKDYRPIPDINITALVDVVLVLLIVFMIAAPMLKSTVDVAVPQAATAKPTDEEGITITIKQDGTILIDDTKVDESSFDIAFNQIYSANSNEPVFLKAAGEVSYATVLTVIDALREEGVTDLGLVADPAQSRTGRRK
ncbi:biopolymer transporter ExbD [bacterium]|nr:biopolymer transporter ExbD [bacterium]MBU1636345.1 biopolymer transporter ExbD [bacterium]